MDLLKVEQAKYDAVWLLPEYRGKCHSLELFHNHQDLFPPQYKSILDIGCGRGRLIKVLSRLGLDTHGVDFSKNCLDPDITENYPHRFHNQCLWEMDLNRVFDLGLCIDVMEHIPETKVMDVLHQIQIHCSIVIFRIANYPSNSLGHELHLTLKPAAWWLAHIAANGGYVIQNDIRNADPREKYYFTWYT